MQYRISYLVVEFNGEKKQKKTLFRFDYLFFFFFISQMVYKIYSKVYARNTNLFQNRWDLHTSADIS